MEEIFGENLGLKIFAASEAKVEFVNYCLHLQLADICDEEDDLSFGFVQPKSKRK